MYGRCALPFFPLPAQSQNEFSSFKPTLRTVTGLHSDTFIHFSQDTETHSCYCEAMSSSHHAHFCHSFWRSLTVTYAMKVNILLNCKGLLNHIDCSQVLSTYSNHFQRHVYLVFVVRSISFHISRKYRYPTKIKNQTRLAANHTYYIELLYKCGLPFGVMCCYNILLNVSIFTPAT